MARARVQRRGTVEDIRIGEIRALTRADLKQLAIGARPKENVVKAFRDSHHMVARLIAAGLDNERVAQLTGYGQNRISLFRNDPAFQELIAQFRRAIDERFVETFDAFASIATANMLKAERQIADHLDAADEEGELLPIKDLVSIARDAADRFGYGKKTTAVNVNLNFAERLAKAVERSSKVIDGKAEPGLASAAQPMAPQARLVLPSARPVAPALQPAIRRRA